MVETLEAVAEQLVHEGERLTRSTAGIVKAIDAVVSKLASLQTPDHVIEIKLAPVIQGLSGVVDTFSKSAEIQAMAIDANLKQTQDVMIAMTELMRELRAAEATRFAGEPVTEDIGVQPAADRILRKASSTMDGEIVQQRSSYRHGLVLGLTMAEIMILLVFCLLIAMATFLKSEQDKRVAAEQKLVQEQAQNESDRDVISALRENTAVAEKLQSLSGSSDPKVVDQYWRELVDSRTAMAELEKSGVSAKEIRDRIKDVATLRANGIDVDKALRDANALAAINRAMSKPGQPPPSTQAILDAIDRGVAGPGPGGHQWPPIIALSDADGYLFKTGSAELSPGFLDRLANKIPGEILENIRKYDVDVIEVVGHTDEQPLGLRQSNLDRDLPMVLNNGAGIASLIPADNAGLGLARAVSVVSVLRQSPMLAGYKLIPLSGAQLVNTDETLAVQGITTGDVPQRRRIEIRLRKSVPRDATASLAPTVAPIVLPLPPKPRPLDRRLPPTPRPAPRMFFPAPPS